MDNPNCKVTTLAKWEVINKEEIDEEKEVCLVEDQEENQEVEEKADEGEMLVLRRALNSQKGEKKNNEKIFLLWMHNCRESVFFDL